MSDGQTYITDVEYTENFYHFLAPAWLSYIAAVNGHEPPPLDGRFTWCELGCGKGLTSLLLAALHPNGEFHACDFNASHIEYAERLRAAAGVANVRFHARSVGDMLAANVPQFDFIVAHGVYSWVPDAVRGEIREFLRRRLKPGGLAMISYNAMPGWAHLTPLRRMMQAYAETVPGTSVDKAKAAFSYVSHLAENGAGYFKMLPAVTKHLEGMAQQDIRYIAHEYLTPHSDPFYFSEVETEMRSTGLSFAGSMAPRDNYAELMAPQQFQELLAGAPTRSALETHRDFIANTLFRQDLYAARPALPRAAAVPLSRLQGMSFCLVMLPEKLPLKQAAQAVSYDLDPAAAAVRAVHALLEKGPASARDIHRALAGCSEEEASHLIQKLVVAEHIAPCPPARAAAGWMKANSVLVEAGMREQAQHVPLACPLTGSASNSEVIHAAVIEAAAHYTDAGEASKSVLSRLRGHRHPVNRETASGERRAATDEEVLDYVSTTWHRMRDPSSADGKLLRLFGLLA